MASPSKANHFHHPHQSDTMTITHPIQPQPQPFFRLFSLPYEIRLLIYEWTLAIHLAALRSSQNANVRTVLPVKNYSIPVSLGICTSPQIQIAISLPFTTFADPPTTSQPPLGPSSLGFSALRLCSKQLEFETRGLIKMPEVWVNVVDDLSMKLCADKELGRFLRQKWVRENLRGVSLIFKMGGDREFPYQGDQVIKRYPSTTVILLRKLTYLLGLATHHWQHAWEFHFVPRHTLAPLCKVLSPSHSFPKLETVTLTTDHEAFFAIWKDPLGDMLGLIPLAKRGVKVEFGTQNVVQWFYFQKVRKRMMGWWGRLRWMVFGKGWWWRGLDDDDDEGVGGGPGRGPGWWILERGGDGYSYGEEEPLVGRYGGYGG